MMRHLCRLYRRPDGGLSISHPAWDDRFSPFGTHMGIVRAAYTLAVFEVLRDKIRAQYADWIAMFPFDPFTVTEAEYYVFAVRNPTGRPRWGPGMTIDPHAVSVGCEVTVGDRFYAAESAGVTGANEPVHTSGSASDGGVLWRYLGAGQWIEDCDTALLPANRDFRNQWRHDGAAVRVDPILETAERWRRIRVERDRRLAASDGPMARATETGAKAAEWTAYRQALRNVPTQADPKAIVWPVPPGQ